MRHTFKLLAATVAAATICSCSTLTGYPTDAEASYAKAIEIAKKSVDTDKFKVYSLSFMEGETLSDNLFLISVKLVNKDNQAFSQSYYMTGLEPTALRDVQRTFEDPEYETTVGIDLTILSVFGGAVGVGLGFGLQKIASNYISGFIILLDKSIKIGDLVTVGGFKGRVTEINTRFTVVRNNDGVENIVPNESFVTSAVLNHSYTESTSVQYIDISVAYDADVERALAIMLEEGMRARPRIDTGRRGWAYLDTFGDSGINLRLGFWVKDPVNGVAGLKTAISLAILKRFAEEGIEVPYNQLEVNLRKVDVGEIPVRMKVQSS